MRAPPSQHTARRRCFTVGDLRGHRVHEAIRPLVLFADDHASVASAISRCLEGEGLAPVMSLELLERVVPVVAPLVLVSDLDFGGTYAFDVLQGLRAAHPALRVIAYSGYDSAVFRRGAAQAGLDGFVAKFDDLDVLCTAVAGAAAELEGQEVSAASSFDTLDARPTRQKPHDAGPVIRWALDSGFKHGAIARVIGVSLQAVVYHVNRRKDGLADRDGG